MSASSLTHLRQLEAESIRVFPLSNWTELDVWQYIHLEHIPIVPLYFAAEGLLVPASRRCWQAQPGGRSAGSIE